MARYSGAVAVAILILAGSHAAAAPPRAAKGSRVPAKPAPRTAAKVPDLEKVSLEFKQIAGSEEASTVVRALTGLPGVKSAVVDSRIRLAVVDYDPRLTRVAALLGACRTAGFEAEEYRVEARFPKPIKLKGG